MLDPTVLIFLTSGLFLGWSLGANDAANVFGTAVGSRMVRFTTAALICGVFVVLGAFVSGTGAAQTLGKLGSVNALGGSFMAALAAGLTVYWMTKLGLPVSTSHAIIGSIIGWNLFSDSYTDITSLLKILSTWIICPLLSAVIAALLFTLAKNFVRKIGVGLIRMDGYTRLALILAGAFGAYSLGANNIANVMGVFVPVAPFHDLQFGQDFSVSSAQQLFLVGGLAIAVGVFTYSKRVMMTVGSELMTLTPLAAWVAVMSHSIVLFLFASERLEQLLANMSLPTIPLVPVSSSQAVVGAVIGIVILIADSFISSRKIAGDFRLHLMPIAVGMYLPFGLSTPILIGGLISHFILKENNSTKEPDSVLQNGILISSGLIAGESLMGILLALVASVGIASMNLGIQTGLVTGLTAISSVVTIWWLYQSSRAS